MEDTNQAPTAEEIAAQAEAERRAAFMAHPHNQLKRMVAQLSAPAANQADVNTRLAYLHSAMRQLLQLMMGMIPPPREASDGEVKQQQQSVEGSQQSQS